MSILSKRQIAYIQIFITAMLWGTTFVLVRMGLSDIGPLTLAGIRYTAAGLLLLPLLKLNGIQLMKYKDRFWQLAVLGVLAFTLGNGFVSTALIYLPSTSVSLLTNLSAPIVLLLGVVWLNEKPRPIQLLGVMLALGGIFIYFSPSPVPFNNPGVIFLGASLFAFAFYSLLGRYLARSGEMPFLLQTAIPFLIGGTLLLIVALFVEGMPEFNLKSIGIIAWMVLFNSITGYTLHNKAIGVLTAFEVNIVLKLAPFSTAFFAWLLTGEKITAPQLLSMVIVFFGIFLVQRGNLAKSSNTNKN
jgi:drug/metabolite transporter (DMT)-like permease